MKLTVESIEKQVTIQDPYPAEGQFGMDIPAGGSVSASISWSTLQRIAEQLSSLEASETILWSVESESGDTRSQQSDAAGLPQIALIDFSALTAAGLTDQKMLGSNLIANQTFASALVGSVDTPNASFTVRTVLPGAEGNKYSVKVIDSGGVGGLAVAMDGDVLVIDFDGDTPDATTVGGAVTSAVGGTFLVTQEGTGADAVALQDETDLEGGAGDGITLTAAGLPCTITAIDESASPQEITFDTPNISAIASVGDTAKIVLRSGAKISDVSVVVA